MWQRYQKYLFGGILVLSANGTPSARSAAFDQNVRAQLENRGSFTPTDGPHLPQRVGPDLRTHDHLPEGLWKQVPGLYLPESLTGLGPESLHF